MISPLDHMGLAFWLLMLIGIGQLLFAFIGAWTFAGWVKRLIER